MVSLLRPRAVVHHEIFVLQHRLVGSASSALVPRFLWVELGRAAPLCSPHSAFMKQNTSTLNLIFLGETPPPIVAKSTNVRLSQIARVHVLSGGESFTVSSCVMLRSDNTTHTHCCWLASCIPVTVAPFIQQEKRRINEPTAGQLMAPAISTCCATCCDSHL